MSGLKTGVENEKFLVWSRVGICGTGQHTYTMDFQEYPQGLG